MNIKKHQQLWESEKKKVLDQSAVTVVDGHACTFLNHYDEKED